VSRAALGYDPSDQPWRSVVSQEEFDAVSDYIIMAKHLCQQCIIVQLEHAHILSYPMCIEDEKVALSLNCSSLLSLVCYVYPVPSQCLVLYSKLYRVGEGRRGKLSARAMQYAA
jgi:hypothetical protein